VGPQSRRWWPSRAPRRASSIALALIVLALATPPPGSAAADDGKAVFDQYCQGCHTIGGGDGTGPDLEGIAEQRPEAWVRRFVEAPDEVIASGDPIAEELVGKYGVEMPNLGLTATQVDAVLAYLGFAATPSPAPQPAPTPPPTTPAPVGSATRGHELFTGAARFDAGGPSCLSCHAVAGVGALGGGRLGPDLTGAYAKFGGAKGLASSLQTVAFPTMAPIFSRRPLTAAERADLVAFLATAPDRQRSAGAARDLLLLAAGTVVLFAALGMAIWRRRLAGVRRPLVARARRESDA